MHELMMQADNGSESPSAVEGHISLHESDQDKDVPELITFSSGEAFFYLIPPAASYGAPSIT